MFAPSLRGPQGAASRRVISGEEGLATPLGPAVARDYLNPQSSLPSRRNPIIPRHTGELWPFSWSGSLTKGVGVGRARSARLPDRRSTSTTNTLRRRLWAQSQTGGETTNSNVTPTGHAYYLRHGGPVSHVLCTVPRALARSHFLVPSHGPTWCRLIRRQQHGLLVHQARSPRVSTRPSEPKSGA